MYSAAGPLAGTVAILVTWAVAALAFVGVGLLVQRGFGLGEVTARRCLLSFWIGLATVVLFLQVVHFVVPIREPAVAIVAGRGGAGGGSARRGLRGSFSADHPRGRACVFLSLLCSRAGRLISGVCGRATP